jgi:hypothetical protein
MHRIHVGALFKLTRKSQVGNEFGQVEGLWSQFENVMAPKDGAGAAGNGAGGEKAEEGRETTTTTTA